MLIDPWTQPDSFLSDNWIHGGNRNRSGASRSTPIDSLRTCRVANGIKPSAINGTG